MKTTVKKQKSYAFGKDVYLLGKNSFGEYLWLESPAWDCGWYWGFGYIETYTNSKSPSKSKDIRSHTHVNYSLMGIQDGTYVHNIYDAPTLVATTFTKDEGYLLSELFEQFYLLQKMAEYCHKKPVPGCNITECLSVDSSKYIAGWYEIINTNIIPKITEKILQILAPEE